MGEERVEVRVSSMIVPNDPRIAAMDINRNEFKMVCLGKFD